MDLLTSHSCGEVYKQLKWHQSTLYAHYCDVILGAPAVTRIRHVTIKLSPQSETPLHQSQVYLYIQCAEHLSTMMGSANKVQKKIKAGLCITNMKLMSPTYLQISVVIDKGSVFN